MLVFFLFTVLSTWGQEPIGVADAAVENRRKAGLVVDAMIERAAANRCSAIALYIERYESQIAFRQRERAISKTLEEARHALGPEEEAVISQREKVQKSGRGARKLERMTDELSGYPLERLRDFDDAAQAFRKMLSAHGEHQRLVDRILAEQDILADYAVDPLSYTPFNPDWPSACTTN